MKKQIRIIIVCIFVVIGIISFIVINSDEKQIYDGGVKYALTIDGNKANNFPSKGMYKVSVNCTNATGKWLYDEWKLSVQDITDTDVTCNIDFETFTKTYFNNYIIGLKGLRQGTGQVVNEKGYRYEGLDPNNYVWFNNEYWRVIGVFDSTSHGQSGKNLVKIIREELLSGLAFDKNNSSNWTTSSLRSLLNENYYNATNGTESGYCYNYSNVITNNCNYTKIGIQDKYRKMIANVTWYLGGFSRTSATTSAFYGYERGTTVYSGRPTSTTGYIGLMYPSDYGYSVLSSSCTRTTNLGSYNSAKCAGQSWLYGKGYELTLTPNSSRSTSVFFLSSNGYLNYSNNANNGYGSRPVLYLDASVYKIDGDGSLKNPYIVGM